MSKECHTLKGVPNWAPKECSANERETRSLTRLHNRLHELEIASVVPVEKTHGQISRKEMHQFSSAIRNGEKKAKCIIHSVWLKIAIGRQYHSGQLNMQRVPSINFKRKQTVSRMCHTVRGHKILSSLLDPCSILASIFIAIVVGKDVMTQMVLINHDRITFHHTLSHT